MLHIYNWADYIGKDTIAEFEARTGIKVVYDTYDSDETLEAKMMAGDSGYDVVSTSTDYFSRQIKAGIYQPLDKALLRTGTISIRMFSPLEAHGDPGNRYAMPYLRHVNGFAYNVDMIRARMPDAPVDSLDMLFKPEVISHFADCGVTFLDSRRGRAAAGAELPAPGSQHHAPGGLRAAEKLLLAVRPYIRAFDSTEYMNGLATGEFCISMSWSADYATSRRAGQGRRRRRAAGLHRAEGGREPCLRRTADSGGCAAPAARRTSS